MSKRYIIDDGDVDEPSGFPPPKRLRIIEADHSTDFLSSLSNEILLHILSFLPIPSLLICQRLSRRFYALAGDSELWKRKYYSQWVRPRARRLANTRRASFPQPRLEYSPKVSTWLDHSHLDRKDKTTNWKRQYHLRHNWSKGICRVTQVEFPQPPHPPMLVTFCVGFVFTVDSAGGLRAWLAESPKTCIAKLPFVDTSSTVTSAPTALTATCDPQRNCIEVVVGFKDGNFSVYGMDMVKPHLEARAFRSRFADGAITAMASSFPYLVMVSEHKVLSLYKLPAEIDGARWPGDAHLLASLKAESILSPMSLSIRVAGSKIILSIVYSFFHIGCGWSLGIQELHFSKTGQQTDSRLTTTVDSQFGEIPLRPFARLANGQYSYSNRGKSISGLYATPSSGPSIVHRDPPTSVSYSHPYLLTSHADNTLTVYLVVSTSKNLFVKGCQRLWGHTSSVLAVQVSDRGKAVSISPHGDEVRIWELEGLISSFGTQKLFQGDAGIRVSPENQKCRKHDGIGLLSGVPCKTDSPVSPSTDLSRPITHMRDCIGFDDERVLLLREREFGAQLLEFYDFI